MGHLLIRGDARRLPIADDSVQCVVTSPPYFGLRDYGVAGQIGLESTPDDFVAAMVEVFREIWRVLRDDGTVWLNLGDSYANDTKWGGASGEKNYTSGLGGYTGQRAKRATGLKPKDLIGIPWRVAFALQADGWYLRSAPPWIKWNPMPESTSDRPSTSHETMFLLTKSQSYFYDEIAVRKQSAKSSLERAAYGCADYYKAGGVDARDHRGCGLTEWTAEADRNLRTSDWLKDSLQILSQTFRAQADEIDRVLSDQGLLSDLDGSALAFLVNARGYKGAHFATFPPKLVEPCVKAGTSEKGCCSSCGSPWERVTETDRVATRPGLTTKVIKAESVGGEIIPGRLDANVVGNRDPQRHVTTTRTTGWQPSCECNAPAVPCVVLDPFNGSGTTGSVATGLGRRYIGTDLNPEYLAMARQRLERPHAAIQRATAEPIMPLFAEATR